MCEVGDQQREQEDRSQKSDPAQKGMNALHLHVQHRSLCALRVLRATGCRRPGARLRCVRCHVLSSEADKNKQNGEDRRHNTEQ